MEDDEIMEDIEIEGERGNPTVSAISEDEQYEDYKRAKRIEEARADVLKIEYDMTIPNLDKTLLKETCKTANAVGLGAIVVYSNFVKNAVSYLGRDPQVSLIAAVSAPHGEDATEIKVNAVKRVVRDGVDEVEVYAPMSKIREGNWMYFKRECRKLKKAARMRALRIVIDCEKVNEKELIKSCNAAADNKVDCIKLKNAGATTVSRVSEILKDRCRIKSDTVENRSQFMNMCASGASYVACDAPFRLADELIECAKK